MKKFSSLVLIIVTLLSLVVPASAAPASAPAEATATGNALSGLIGIYSVSACQDTTTFAVSGTSTNATNRIKAWIYKQGNNGEWLLLANTVTGNFTSGTFLMPIVLNYFDKTVSDGKPLQIVVKLQGMNGNSFVDLSNASTTLNASDKKCQNKCSVTINTNDKAPADGVITLRSHFGSFFRPEGWLHSAMPIKAGQRAFYSVVALPCDWTVRAWYYPATGKDRTPKLLTAQYWPYDFAATLDDGANPYTASFAKSLKATSPLEPGDPYAPK